MKSLFLYSIIQCANKLTNRKSDILTTIYFSYQYYHHYCCS